METSYPHPLRRWRLDQEPELSVAEAAEKAGVTRQTWYEWEKWSVPNSTLLPKVCELTGLEPNDFYKVERPAQRPAQQAA
jgi:DNA-binding XRE family transcriptional regulator